ncbi:hypothetical protein NN561_019802 [Cricetulus griseus]
MIAPAARREEAPSPAAGPGVRRAATPLRPRLGAGTPSSLPHFPPSSDQGRGARPGSRRPAPAGNNGRGQQQCCGRRAPGTAPERERTARAPPGSASGGRLELSACVAAQALRRATRVLASPPLAEPGRRVLGTPAAAERSPAARRAYISGRLSRSALRQRSGSRAPEYS